MWKKNRKETDYTVDIQTLHSPVKMCTPSYNWGCGSVQNKLIAFKLSTVSTHLPSFKVPLLNPK